MRPTETTEDREQSHVQFATAIGGCSAARRPLADDPQIGGRQLAAALVGLDVEVDDLPFLHPARNTRFLKRANMHEDVFKDLLGTTQYLVIPTDTITGIESPSLLAPDAPNYWEDAWQARRFMEEGAGRPVPRDVVGLAINSQRGRSQNQLHIHIDCARADDLRTLSKNETSIHSAWRPLPVRLARHSYLAIRIEAPDLSHINPFRLLAEGVPTARADMGDQTLVVIAATFKDGRDGFYLLNDHADIAKADTASGEELLDHSCAVLGPTAK